MVLIISSPISSHVKQKEGGNTALGKHTLAPHSPLTRLCGALCSMKQAQRLGTTRKDQCPNIWEGERNNSEITANSPWSHSMTRILRKFVREERKMAINV